MALFQLALGVAFLRAVATGPGAGCGERPSSEASAITAVWAISRTVGLPFLAGGAESIGTADAVATVLQIATVVILVAIGRRPSAANQAHVPGDRPRQRTRSRGSPGPPPSRSSP